MLIVMFIAMSIVTVIIGLAMFNFRDIGVQQTDSADHYYMSQAQVCILGRILLVCLTWYEQMADS